MKFLKGLTEANKKFAAETVKLWHEAVTEIKPDLCLSGTLVNIFGWAMVRHFNTPTLFFALQPVPANPPRQVLGLPNIPCCGLNGVVIRYIVGNMAKNGH